MEERIKTMLPLLNEYQKRIFLASEAIAYGWGGIQKVSEISGASMNTIRKGIAEIEGIKQPPAKVGGVNRRLKVALRLKPVFLRLKVRSG